PLQLLSSDRRADRPEVTLPPRKRLRIVHRPGYEAGESSAAAAARSIEVGTITRLDDWLIRRLDVLERLGRIPYDLVQQSTLSFRGTSSDGSRRDPSTSG
nr:hypothetical protein [Tanacetum cinerariifolium]